MVRYRTFQLSYEPQDGPVEHSLGPCFDALHVLIPNDNERFLQLLDRHMVRFWNTPKACFARRFPDVHKLLGSGPIAGPRLQPRLVIPCSELSVFAYTDTDR